MREGDDAIESAIANHELAFRMQWSVPGLMDLAIRMQRAGIDGDWS